MFRIADACTGDIKEIYTPQEITGHVINTLSYYQQELMEARAQARKTREEVAADIKNEYEKENARLKEELRFSFGFLNSEKEVENWNNFIKEHEACRFWYKDISYKKPYIIPYETSLGRIFRAHCPICETTKTI